jgi:chromosome segregation ATPase
MKHRITYYLVVGLLIGFLMVPPPVQAQMTVWDPTNYGLQLAKKIEEANRWLETLQHYATMVDKTIQQLTTMKGVLETLHTELDRHMRLVRFINSVSQVVQGSLKLKRQLESMIQYRIKMLKDIDERLQNGLFDPEQDLKDLEEYFKYTLGRSAAESVARLDKLARNDSQLESWTVRRTKIQKDLAVAHETLKQAEQQLANEKTKDDADQSDMSHLNDVILQQQKMIADLEKEHADLQDKITERVAKYGLRLQDLETFAFKVSAVNDSFESVQQLKDQLDRLLGNLISNTEPATATP